MTGSIKIAMMLLALSTSTATFAQAGAWKGHWKTDYGPLKLIEQGDYVYGDYQGDKVLMGKLNARKNELRALFIYPDGRSGYVNFVQSGDDGDRISGKWIWSSQKTLPFPDWQKPNIGGTWRGTRNSSYQPGAENFAKLGFRPYESELFSRSPMEGRAWLSWELPSGSAQFLPGPREISVLHQRIKKWNGRPFWGSSEYQVVCVRGSTIENITEAYGQPTRVFSEGANNATMLSEFNRRLTFRPSRACQLDPKARVRIIYKTNFTTGGTRPYIALGNQNATIYVDQLPKGGGTRKIDKFEIAQSGSKWPWAAWMQKDNKSLTAITTSGDFEVKY